MFVQAAMEALNALPSVKLSDLKERKLSRPLVVSSLTRSHLKSFIIYYVFLLHC